MPQPPKYQHCRCVPPCPLKIFQCILDILNISVLPYLKYMAKLKPAITAIWLNLAENRWAASRCCDLLSTNKDVYDNITISSELGGNDPGALVVAGLLGQRVMIDDRIFAINVADPMEQQHHGAPNKAQFSFRLAFHQGSCPKSLPVS